MARQPKEPKVELAQEAPKAEVAAPLVDLSKALMSYRNMSKKGMLIKYREALKAHAKQMLPEMEASVEKWHELFDKF